MPAVVTNPPLPHLTLSGSFLLLFSPADPTHLPHMGLGSRKLFSSVFFNLVSFFSKQPSSITRAQMTENKHSRRTFSLCHKPPLRPHTLREVVSASQIYLHASSSRRSTGVHGLDVTGFAASDHKAPAHSIANNLGAKHQQEIKQLTRRSATLLFLAAAGTSPPSPQQFPHPSAGGFALKEAGLWRGKCGVGM